MSSESVPEKKSTFWRIVGWIVVAYAVWLGAKLLATIKLETEYANELSDVPSLNKKGSVAFCLADSTWSANGLVDMVSYDLDRLPKGGLKSPSKDEVSGCMKPGTQTGSRQP